MPWGGGHGRHIAPSSGHVAVPNTTNAPFEVSLAKKEWNSQILHNDFLLIQECGKAPWFVFKLESQATSPGID
jgi:hypothetical protein